jgi:RHS repeat-associated protein
VSAFHPSAIAGSAQSTFSIVGFAFNYTHFTTNLAQNSSYRFETILINTGAEPLTGLAFTTPVVSGTGLSVVLDNLPTSLDAGAERTIGVTVSATPSASSGTVNVVVSESHGYTRTLPVIAAVSPAVVIPATEPQQFLVGVLGGETRLQTIFLRNLGFDTWRDVELSTPALSFVTLQGPKQLGDIPPGGNITVTLAIAPSLSQPNQTYNPSPLLQVLSANAPALAILGSVAVTSTRKGAALVSVINADKPRSASGQGEGIAGASLTLISLDISGLSFKVTADLNGVASFTDIPSGNYVWRAESSGFQAKSGTVVIEPGVTNLVEAILVTSVVTYEWKVTPTTITDKYQIALAATFRTDVPAPLLVSDPPMIGLNMVGGQTAYSQFAITNRGLIAATKVKVNFSGSAAVQVTMPFDEIPVILPGQSVVVPIKIFLVHASCEGASALINALSPCAAGTLESRSYSGTSIVAGNLNGQSCGGGGPGTASSGGGGGGVSFSAPISAVAAATPGAGSVSSCAVGPKSRHKANAALPGNPDKNVDIDQRRPNISQPVLPCKPGSPGIGLDFEYRGDGAGGEYGTGWAADFGYEIRINPDGTYSVKGPDGAETVYAPVGDLLQPLNGSGPLFARPVNVDRQLANPAPTSGEGKVCLGGDNTLSYHGYSWTRSSGGCSASTGDHFTVCPGPDPTPASCGATGMIAAYHEIRNSQGDVETYEYYNSTGAYRLTRYADKNGSLIKYIRSNEGRVDRIEDSHGRFINLVYDAAGRLTGTTDWAGRTTAFTYDLQGRRLSMRDPIGDLTAYAYAAADRMAQITYPNGGRLSFAYDAGGKVVSTSEDNGVNFTQYASSGSSSLVTDALGRVTRYETIENNGLKRFSKIIDPAGGVTSILYDAEMNPRAVTDPLGRTTNIQTAYNDDGSLQSQSLTDALGNRQSTTYGAGGNFPVNVADAKGNVTSMAYDDKRNLIQVTDAQSNSTRMSYDAFGHVVGLKDALGNVTAMAYNNNGAMTSVTDPLGRIATITRDNLSRATAFKDPANKQTAMAYDAADQVTQVTDADNGATVVTYEQGRDGRLPKTVRDAKNQITTMNYDVQGRVTSAVNALNQSAAISYDAKSRPTSVTTRNGELISFAYDNLDRLITLTAPEGNIGMTYDAVGHMLTANSYNGSALAMSYDAADRVTQVVQTLPNAHNITIGYSFDANANRTGMTTPLGNFSYTYDTLDRITSITNPYGQIVTFSYDALGRRTSMSYPNGTQANYAYDAAGQIAQVLHQKTADQTAIAFTNYNYDLSGNRTGLTDARGNHAFTYDVLNRLATASHPGFSETFDYDAVGNRTADAVRTGYTYNNANRIVSDSLYTYTSDPNGNVTSRTNRATGVTTTLAHDSGNKVTEVAVAGSAVGAYKYDPAGRRVEKNVGGTITRFIYDGPNILAILDENNNLLALFTHGPGIDSPLIMRKGTQDYFYHADALGNVVALTDSSANIVETYEYSAFGKTTIKDASGTQHDTSTVGNPFMYTSREYDAESGFYFYRARYYDPETGRFMEEDPIPSINQYVYVANNPALLNDPLGLCPQNRIKSAGNATLNAIGGFGNGVSLGYLGEFGLLGDTGSSGAIYDPSSDAFVMAQGLGFGVTAGLVSIGGVAALGAIGLGKAATVGQAGYYPPNGGFSGTSTEAMLRPGAIVDRFGGTGGSYLSPQGTPWWQRSLPFGGQNQPLNTYEVMRPIPVNAGPTAPWFNQLGGGMQFQLRTTVQNQINSGNLRKIK